MARKKKSFPTQTIINTINDGNVDPTITALAKVYGVSWVIFKNWVLKHPEIQEALDNANEVMVEQAENVIRKALDSGDYQIAKWILSVRDKKYREQQDINVDGTLKINISDASKKKKDEE